MSIAPVLRCAVGAKEEDRMRRGLPAASLLALALAACGDTTTNDSLADDNRADTDLGDTDTTMPPPDDMATEPPPPGASPDVAAGTAADNTGQNAGDVAATPMDQSNEPKDMEITRQIRERIVEGDGDPFSTDAQNVKVVTSDGVVTLEGPVENEREKEAITAIARATEGVKRVEDKLEVASR
jgi:hyperosmotically inducible protein